MSEQEDPGTELVKASSTGEVAKPSEMDLETARRILQTIVDTHENTITEETPLDTIGSYSTEEVRRAERTFAEWLMQSNNAKKGNRNRYLQKATPQGGLDLYLEDTTVFLRLANGNVYDMENRFALEEPQDAYARMGTSFSDFRSGRSDVVSLLGLGANPTLARYRHMVRGLRWMNANMLRWGDPDATMPEQLDTPSLPQAPPNNPPAIGK